MTIIRLPHGQFEYDETQPLGKPGGFGQVFAGRSATDQNLAVKKLHLSAAEAAHRELKIADELSGRVFMHVIQFLDSEEDASSGDYFIVMPQASGSLQDVIDVKSPLGSSETAQRTIKLTRDALVQEAFERLRGIANNLWHAISYAAPGVITKSEAAGQFVEYQLGEGTLWLGVGGPMSALGRDVFRESKWDVITFSQIGVRQSNPQLVWSASLWFSRLPGTADYRWYEVSYIDISESGGLIANAELNFRDADLAVATTVMHSKAVAFGPKAIDDEDEADFQKRWLWLLARAASGRLNYVATSPITNWPPSLL